MTADERRARRFLFAVSLVFLPIFAIPLLLHPYGWARRFGWRDEPETDVGRYFGRCLGAIAVAVMGEALAASRDPREHRSLFTVLEGGGWLLSAVHLRGLVEQRQPPIENAEVAGYAAFALLARRCRP
jgi:hypothetical protein